METRFRRWQYLLTFIVFIPEGGLVSILINPLFEYHGSNVVLWGFAGMLLYVNIKTNPKLTRFLLIIVVLPLYELIFNPSVFFSGQILPILLSDFAIFLTGVLFGPLFYKLNKRT